VNGWAIGILFVGSITYTVVDITRRITNAWDAREAMHAPRRLRPTLVKQATTRTRMARPMTLKERNARRHA
jgi:hypothetical protein